MGLSIEDVIVSIVDERVNQLVSMLKEEIQKDNNAIQQQVLFNQNALAKKLGVTAGTIYNWRKLGLKSEANPTGGLLFDIQKVKKWREENDNRKIR